MTQWVVKIYAIALLHNAAGTVSVAYGRQRLFSKVSPGNVQNLIDNAHAIHFDSLGSVVLPLLTYGSDLTKAIEIIRARPKPLAMYVFSQNESNIDRLL